MPRPAVLLLLRVLLTLVVAVALAPAAMAQAKPKIVSSPYIPWTAGWVSGDPYQGGLSKPVKDIFYNSYRITPKNEFSMKALVLSTKRYARNSGDHPSNLAPVDFAVGWGPMSDPEILKHINVGQQDRWYFFRSGPLSKISMDGIYRHSGNMHMIPATEEVKAKLLQIQRGDVVAIRGYLVDVQAPVGGWRWVSSVSREDRGDGSCEVIYVMDVEVLKAGVQWTQYPERNPQLRD